MKNRNMCLRSRERSSESGVALLTVVFISALLLVIALAVSFVLYYETLSSARTTSVTQALYAAEGGQEYGRIVLEDALKNMVVPASLTYSELEGYANDADSGMREGDKDIGVLVDFFPAFSQFLPRGEMGVVSGTFGEGSETVEYQLAYDFTPTRVDYPDPADPTGAFIFYYHYEILAKGKNPHGILTAEQVTKLSGDLEVTIFHPSFSFYDFFTVVMQTASGQQIYFASNETLDGPVYVGSRPGFAGNNAGGGPTFTDQFQTTWPSWDTAAKVYNPVVKWSEELPPLWGVEAIPTPQNSFSQARAALGNYARVGDTSTLTNLERRESLGLTPSNSAPPTDVYYTKGDGRDNQGNDTDELLGGIYIYGSVDSMRLGASGSQQIISITQGTTTTTFTIDNSAGTTTVMETGKPVRTFNDVPNGVVYVDGTLMALGRGAGYSAAIEEDSQLTIAADQNLYVNNHINYEVDPTQDPDALNVLGLVSGRGNVLVSNNAPSNLVLQATIFATADGRGFGVQNYATKPPSGALNILGGLIMDTYQAIGTFSSRGQVSGYYKNFHYDRRFLNRAFSPPFFPVVTTYVGRLKTINRTDWGQVVTELPPGG